MKDLSDITCCTVDYGTFISLAQTMGQKVKKSYYYSPYEAEYLTVEASCPGIGMPHIERLNQPLDPDILPEIDLFLFPDRGYAGLQKHLRYLGKPIWGSYGACELEESRTRFLDILNEFDMPVVHTEIITGLTKLSEHLKGVERKWIKLNRYRGDMETWKHIDYLHSQRELERLAYKWGPAKEFMVFVVQDEIEGEDGEFIPELGYDGWSVLGQYPDSSFQGHEQKNELYLGSKINDKDLPDYVKYVNEKFAPILKDIGYCNFWATEIRVKDKKPHFIDPTARMPGQTGEHLLKTCTNLPEVIWSGANGELIVPQFEQDHAAEATVHYTGGKSTEYKTFVIPDSVRDWFKPYHCFMADGAYHVTPGVNDEVGVILGNGNSTEAAMGSLKSHMEELKDEPLTADLYLFAELLEKIHQAEEEGIEFSRKPVPEPEVAVR